MRRTALDDGLIQLGLRHLPAFLGSVRPDEAKEWDVRLSEGPRDEGTGAAGEELADGGGGADLGGELVHVVAVVDAVGELLACEGMVW